MGVTFVICASEGCRVMLNGEICHFVHGKPYCNEHYEIVHAEDSVDEPEELEHPEDL